MSDKRTEELLEHFNDLVSMSMSSLWRGLAMKNSPDTKSKNDEIRRRIEQTPTQEHRLSRVEIEREVNK